MKLFPYLDVLEQGALLVTIDVRFLEEMHLAMWDVIIARAHVSDAVQELIVGPWLLEPEDVGWETENLEVATGVLVVL